MTVLTRGVRIPIVGALLGIGVIGVLRRRRRHRPTGAELQAMDERSFTSFVESLGLKTVTTADLRPTAVSSD